MRFFLPLACLMGSLLLTAQTPPPKPKAKAQPKAVVQDEERRAPKRYRLPERELVNINGASKSELMARLGLSAELAEKVVQGRPYRSKADLVTKKIMSEAQWQSLRYNIIAKQPTTPVLAKP